MVISDFVFEYHCFKKCVTTRSSWRQVGTEPQNFKAAFNSFSLSSHWNCRRTLNRCCGAKGLCESITKGWILFFDYHRCLHSSSILISKSSRFFCVKRQTETNFAICTAKLRTNSSCTFKEIKPIISVVQLKEKAVMLLCASHASIFSFLQSTRVHQEDMASSLQLLK